MKIKSVESQDCHIIQMETGEIYRRTGSMFWEKMGDKWWECFPFEQELEGIFQEYMIEKRKLNKKIRTEEFFRMLENEAELGRE